MADNRYENDLLAREYQNIDVDTDYIRTLDENGVSYKDDMARIAKVFVETYGGSALAGSMRTMQQAFADLAGDIATNAENIATNAADIEERTCTPAELTALEEALGIGGE